MKKTHANWHQEITLDAACPHCGRGNDIIDEFECEDYFSEMDEDSLDGMEIVCWSCGKTFGINETING